MNFKQSLLYTAAMAAGLVNTVPAQEDYSQWAHSKEIVINTTSAGYDINGNLYRFPYLVRLSAKSFDFRQAGKNGQDLRFAKKNGVHLPFQIEMYDSSLQKAAVWVNVDTIFGNNAIQSIQIFWGKKTAVPASNGAAVFDSANGFKGVWHLNEPASDSSKGYADASGNGKAGTGHGAVHCTGVAGYGKSTDGFAQYIEMGSVGISGNVPRTIDGWVKGESTYDWSTAFGFAPNAATNSAYFDFEGFTTTYTLHLYGVEYNTKDVSCSDNQWRHLAATYNGTTTRVYADGVEKANGSTALSTVDLFRIGWREQTGVTGYFKGKYDEIRVSNIVRSPDWIKLCFKNQKYIPEAPPAIRYPHRDNVLTVNEIYTLTPTVFGDTTDSITIRPDLPKSLYMDGKTGEINGWLDSVLAKKSFIVRAYNAAGFSEDTITITGVDLTSLKQTSGHRDVPGIKFTVAIRPGAPRIVFSVPTGKKTQKIEFFVYTVSGAQIWSSVMHAGDVSAGSQSIVVTSAAGHSPLCAGIYFATMKMFFIGGPSPEKRTITFTIIR